MPEDFIESPGVEEVPAAEEHIETPPVDASESGADEVAAEPEKQNNFQKAFAKRLSEAQAKWEQEVSQKYGDYDTVKQRTSYLEKRARQEGFSDVETYLQAIDDLERQQQYERESQRMGLDPETYAQYFAPVNEKASALEQKVQALESQLTERQRQEQAQAQWGELYSQYPGLVESSTAFNEGNNPDWFTPQMQELVGMGYKPVHAYELAHKDTMFRQKEQETIARLTGRDAKQVLPSTDSPNNMQFDPDNMSLADIDAISARVRRGERITF